MARTYFLDHEGHRILLLDFSGLSDQETALQAIAEAKAFIAGQPNRSLLTLTHVKGSSFTGPVIQALKDLALHDKPYVKAAAIVGMSGLQRIVYTAVTLFSQRSFQLCGDLAEAKRWLAAQDAPTNAADTAADP